MEDGINWNDEAPEEALSPSLRVLRTPEKKPLRGLIVSSRLHGCYTHFYGGQTVPCIASRCKACADRNGRRWHFYLALMSTETREVALWETTAKAAAPMEALQRELSSLRGVGMYASRVAPRANAGIIVRLFAQERGKYALPDEPNVRACLRQIWKLDSTTRHTSDQEWEQRAIAEYDGVTIDGEFDNEALARDGVQPPRRFGADHHVHEREAEEARLLHPITPALAREPGTTTTPGHVAESRPGVARKKPRTA